MRKFKFRLKRVLDYRLKLEEKAEKLYIEAKNQREAADRILTLMREQRRQTMMQSMPFSVDSSIQRALFIEAMEDRIARQESIINILLHEETKQREQWLTARKSRKTIEKLRDQAWNEYLKETDKEEQRDMDERSAMRYKAA